MRFQTVVFVAAALLAAGVAAGSQSTVRSYGIEGVGTLELDVPLRWKEDIGWTDGDHRPALTFKPDEGETFVLTVAVMPRPADAPDEFGTLPWLKAVVETSARSSLGVGPDQALGLEEIGEGRVVGWYYSVTDSALPDPPPAGSFRVMTQGASAAGSVVLTATLLTQRSWGEEVNEGMRILRTARITTAPPDAWRVPGENVKARGGVGQRYEVDIPAGFERMSSNPLQLRDKASGGLVTIEVTPTTTRSNVKSELQRLSALMDRHSPGSWVTRRTGPALLGGRAAARLIALDELRDEVVATWALPLSDAVLTLTWRVHPKQERAAEPRLQALLATFRLK